MDEVRREGNVSHKMPPGAAAYNSRNSAFRVIGASCLHAPSFHSQRGWPDNVQITMPYHIMDSREVPYEAPLATKTSDLGAQVGSCNNPQRPITNLGKYLGPQYH